MIKILTENGAVDSQKSAELKGPAFMSSISRSLPLLCERFQFNHAEAWVSARAGKELTQVEVYDSFSEEENLAQVDSNIANDGSNALSSSFQVSHLQYRSALIAFMFLLECATGKSKLPFWD